MQLALWKNPEWIRHQRADLRPSRLFGFGLTAALICGLLAVGVFGSAAQFNRHKPVQELWREYYQGLLTIQAIVLSLWALLAGAQAIASERSLKTFDFLRTTRLTAVELALGKLFGAPVTAWFVVLASMAVSIPAGLLGGLSLGGVLLACLIVISLGVVLGLLGLVVSSMLEKPNAGVALLFYFIATIAISIASHFSLSFPGLRAISPSPALDALSQNPGTVFYGYNARPTIFGQEMSYAVCTLLIYWTLSAWFFLVLVRNLKREYDDVQALAPWQAPALVAYVLLLVFAFFQPPPDSQAAFRYPTVVSDGAMLGAAGLTLTFLLLYAVGLAMLTPKDRLKTQWHQRKPGEWLLDPYTLAWPWLALAVAAAFALFVIERWRLWNWNPVNNWSLGLSALNLLVALVYITRDVLFVQWCVLTRMKSAVAKGAACVGLYYVAVAVIFASIFGQNTARRNDAFNLLTWFRVTSFPWDTTDLATVWIGMGLQLAVIVLTLRAIRARIAQQPRASSLLADVAAD